MAFDPASPFSRKILVAQSLQKATLGSAAKFCFVFGKVRAAYPEETAHFLITYVAEKGPDEISKKVVPWLCSQGRYLAQLLDPALLPVERAKVALETFRVSDEQFSPRFSQLLSPENREVNSAMLQRALELLAGLRTYESFVPHLQVLAKHSDPYVRSKAVKVLCRIRPNKSLVERHIQCDDPRVRANALEALWHINTDEAKSLFEGSLVDPDHRVVLNAVVGLYFLNDPKAVELLMELAEHPSVRFRRATVWALGLLADPRTRPALEKLLSDPSPLIRANARRAFAKLPPEAVAEPEMQANVQTLEVALAATEMPTTADAEELFHEGPAPDHTRFETPAFKLL